MKEKVRQQEEDLNAKNPSVFMEAQSASKQEVWLKRLNHFTSGSKNLPLTLRLWSLHFPYPTICLVKRLLWSRLAGKIVLRDTGENSWEVSIKWIKWNLTQLTVRNAVACCQSAVSAVAQARSALLSSALCAFSTGFLGDHSLCSAFGSFIYLHPSLLIFYW